jgi:hypothetical protein
VKQETKSGDGYAAGVTLKLAQEVRFGSADSIW